MATTKTLAPTNQTITIAGFQGEKPDQRQVADAEGKMADAINALNSQKASYEEGTWTPHLYDYTTKLRELTDGRYIKIGGLTFAYYYSNNPNLSGISTMLQIKNLPMATVLAGGIYIGALTDGNGGKITVQSADGSIYFRPNIVSSQLSNVTSPGYVNFWAIGI